MMKKNKKSFKGRYIFPIIFSVLTLNACGQDPDKTTIQAERLSPNYQKTDDQWKKELSEEQYYVLRQKGTEAPFSGKLLLNKEQGVYKCAACGNELFSDDMKFESHCGWPSFDKEISGGKIITHEDFSHGMHRTEIECARCGGHLGHLFDDGPTETGMRYCVNSASLTFTSEKELQREKMALKSMDTLTLGGGCYWCVEAVYEMLEGVQKVVSGYSGGKVPNPSYQEVCSGASGHAEVVQIVFDPSKISIDELLKVFFTVHDPTTLNSQGADKGTQYRSVIFYRNEKQQNAARGIIESLNREVVYDSLIVTQVVPFTLFYKAENYHQNYYFENKEEPYCRMVIQPKIEKFEKVFKDRLKKDGM